MTPEELPDPAKPDSARTLHLVLDSMSDLVAMLDVDGKRLYNSPSYKALFGDRDLNGSDSFVDIHPDDRDRVRRVFRETVASGVGQRTEYRFVLADGRTQTGQHGIAKADWATRTIGTPLAISYDRERPSRNFPDGYGVTSLGMTIFVSAFGAVFAAFGAAILIAPWKWPADRPRPPRGA